MPISKVLKRTGLIDLNVTGATPQYFVTIDTNHLSMFEDNFDSVSNTSFSTVIHSEVLLLCFLKPNVNQAQTVKFETSFVRYSGTISEIPTERQIGGIINLIGTLTNPIDPITTLATGSAIYSRTTAFNLDPLFPNTLISGTNISFGVNSNVGSPSRDICIRWYLTLHASDLPNGT